MASKQSDLKQLMRKRDSVEQRLNSFMKYIDSVKNASDSIPDDVAELQLKIDRFQCLFQEFEEIQLDIEVLCSNRDIQDEYCLAVAKGFLKVVLPDDKFSNSGSSQSPNRCSQDQTKSNNFKAVKLPPIHLPVFNAEYLKWIEFKDTFEALINQNLSPSEIQKYHYLRVSLGQEALKIIQSLEIDRDFYVDDLITGFPTESQAISTCKEIHGICKSASFHLRKWTSNSSIILDTFRDDSDSLGVLSLGDNESIKTLGIQWFSKRDMLSYEVNVNQKELSVTKRVILSTISKIYDPLGMVSPCTILAKIIIQKLWTLKLGWDEEVPLNLKLSWQRSSPSILNELMIPRYVMCPESCSQELHGSSDASKDAYSAAIYMRTNDSERQVYVQLLCAKTKVAPLKVLTIPRLKLCGALLLAQLMNTVRHSLSSNLNYFLWCDSQIMLHWINMCPNSLQVFVANRVSEIRNLTEVNKWNYVSTKQNSADVASRGLYPEDLLLCQLWWKGPPFLKNDSEWPPSFKVTELNDIPDIKRNTEVLTVIESNCFNVFTRYSKFSKLVRVFTYCCRFISNIKQKIRNYGPLSVIELNESRLKLVKLAQTESFSHEIKLLKSQKEQTMSKLSSLAPFLDTDGLLRVGGRLKNSSLTYNEKHPLLLNGKHPLTLLLFEHEHIQLQHAGPQLLLYSVRQNYWTISGMSVAKRVVKNCVRCFRFKPKPVTSIMADLPENRVKMSSPFTITGVDYAGPVLLKDRKGRGSKNYKAYICLFICFASKAVHLELVSSLTTEAFLATFRRFVSRRGKPSHLYSDNASNFVGEDRELKVLFDFLKNAQDDLVRACADHGIVWHFIPPSTPNFGGLWESNVKGVKSHLHRVIGDTVLTYEEFSTLLIQIEATLNSRPLYAMSSDPNDLESLTPSHFLIGKPISTVPDPLFSEDVKLNQLARYQLLQQLNQSFWKTWSQFYLSHLQQRQKWKSGDIKLRSGLLVLLKNDNLPPCKWLLGRIVDTPPGKDGVVRLVTIKTATGLLKRGISKVCPLPCASD